jgi:CO/xanthine dehydrogenase Mo-binding subunit
VADRLGHDRVAVRRRNLITAAEMPFPGSCALSAAKSHTIPATIRGFWTRRWQNRLELAAGRGRRRTAGELVGAGRAIFVDKGGLGPLDGTRITVDAIGAVELVTGGSAVGPWFRDGNGIDVRPLGRAHPSRLPRCSRWGCGFATARRGGRRW